MFWSFVFCFKQKTAYEMRISDWSSDVCSSDLEKPIFLPSETDPVPFQIFRIGNLAVLGVPFEVTTMSGRRLRKTVLDALSPVGVDTVIIAGLSNDCQHYMATPEEYSAQTYEGPSTTAGQGTEGRPEGNAGGSLCRSTMRTVTK